MSVHPDTGSTARGSVPPLRHFVAVAAASLFLSLPFLGKPALFDPDEGYYPTAAVEMLARGDWLDPVFNAEPRWGKPVGIYFLQCLSVSALGKNELAVRLPSAAAGLGLGFLCLLLGARLFGARAGLYSGLAGAGMLQCIVYSRSAVPDMLLALGVAFALWGFAATDLGRKRFAEARAAHLALYLGCALGFLAKGPLGVILPGLAVFLFVALSRDWRILGRMGLFRGALVFLAAAAPWFVWMYGRHGMEFITEIFLRRNIDHYFTNRWQHEGPLYYYLPVLLVGAFPWTAALAGGLWRSAAGVRDVVTRRGADPAARANLFLWCWAFGMLLFLSLSHGKLPNYVLPLYPALAALAGAYVAALEGSERGRGWLGWGSAVLALAVLAAGLVLLPCKVHVPVLLALAALSPLGLIALAGLSLRRGVRLWSVLTVLSMAVLFGLSAGLVLPRVEKLNAVRTLAAECAVTAQDNGPVLFHRCWAPAFLFYSGRGAVRFDPEREDLRAYLAGSVRWVLTRPSDLPELVRLAGYEPSWSRTVDGRVLLRFEPPVLLTRAQAALTAGPIFP
ncbi:glycosyltransferase family 39 protein [bacterium]|nr:glycosyltransferase family 39 protein [bacterium]